MIDKSRRVISKEDFLDIMRYILKAPISCNNADIKQRVLEKWPHLNLESRSLRRRIQRMREALDSKPLTDEQIEQLLVKYIRGYNVTVGKVADAREKYIKRRNAPKCASARRRKKAKPKPKPKPKPEPKPKHEHDHKVGCRKEYIDLRTKTAKMLSVKVGDIGKEWKLCRGAND